MSIPGAVWAVRARGRPWMAWTLLVAVLAGWGAWQRHQRGRAETAGARYATTALLEHARADGWEARAGTEATGRGRLLGELARGDVRMRTLAAQLDSAGAQPVARTVVRVVAGDTVRVAATAGPDSASADLQDGPLSAHISYTARPAPSFGVAWQIDTRLELVHALGADRRLLVFARSSDPRVHVDVDTLTYQLPRLDHGPSRLKWAGIGAVVGAGLARLF